MQKAGTEAVLAYFTCFEAIATTAVTQAEMTTALTKASHQGWM